MDAAWLKRVLSTFQLAICIEVRDFSFLFDFLEYEFYFLDFDTIAATGWAESDDDALLQFAIQQSLHQQSTGHGGGAAFSDGAAMQSAAFMNRLTTEDLDLQR